MPSTTIITRTAPDLSELSDIYIDETSQNNHHYLLLGGIIIPTPNVAEINNAVMDHRLPELPSGEAKWAKVSKSKLPAYKRLVDAFFDDPRFGPVHFHSLVVDTHEQNHIAFNDGSREIGFNKEIYQLASKFARLYGTLFHLYPDQRKTNSDPNELRLILNRGRKKQGDQRDWPFRRCQFRDSKKCLPLQVVDILSGAIAFRINGHFDAPNASPPKCELSDHVLSRAGVSNPFRDTKMSGKFTIWHRKLQKASRSPRP